MVELNLMMIGIEKIKNLLIKIYHKIILRENLYNNIIKNKGKFQNTQKREIYDKIIYIYIYISKYLFL